jgi:signal transduction histidine kinase
MAAEPMCTMAHDLLNKLTAVIAECELLLLENPESSAAHRALVIKEMSVQMAERVSRHQCRVSEILRTLTITR